MDRTEAKLRVALRRMSNREVAKALLGVRKWVDELNVALDVASGEKGDATAQEYARIVMTEAMCRLNKRRPKGRN